MELELGQALLQIDEWAANGKATCMSNKDQIIAFLKMIPKDCKHSKLFTAQQEREVSNEIGILAYVGLIHIGLTMAIGFAIFTCPFNASSSSEVDKTAL